MAQTFTPGDRVNALRNDGSGTYLDSTGTVLTVEPRDDAAPWLTILFGDGKVERKSGHGDFVEKLTAKHRAWWIAARPDMDVAGMLAASDAKAAAALAAYRTQPATA